jgi:Cu(I)/Ag(I) efflux system membrane protein CusA/SilA
MKRIATPMVGGMLSATVLTLVVVPAIYGLWKGVGLPLSPPVPSEEMGRKKIVRKELV